jgi:heme a synthase
MNYIKINRRSGILTISSVFLLLIAGGFVRSTGSGMGCPDWPKCYGAWFPPTCDCQLPANYQEIYTVKRVQKAKRFANVLSSLGFKSQSESIVNDPNLYKPEVFNTRKAWTEYINRIIGVLSGLFSLVFMLSLLKIRRYINRTKFWAGILGFIMMLFNAWLGSIVVATNLFPIIISIHYLADLIKFKWFYVSFVIFALLQVVFGTQLREISDQAVEANALIKKNEINFERLGSTFNYHWFLAILLIVLSLIPLYFLRNKIHKKWFRLVLYIPLTLIIQYFSGVLNLRYGFPLLAQVSHIFFAGIIFGITLYICISIFRAPKNTSRI